MAPPRHLDLLGAQNAQLIPWPVPFADGVDQLMALRGRPVVVLASGDPFWFGAGAVLARQLARDEWISIPAPSCFSLAANALGWALEQTIVLGLHAAPLARLRPHLAPGRRILCTLRDGAAVAELAGYLAGAGFGPSALHILSRLGGPHQKIHSGTADSLTGHFDAPVLAGIDVAGSGHALPLASGISDDFFETDGQITKRPIRALTLSALAPRPNERLWDIGGGSGSIAIEWLLRDPTLQAVAFEQHDARAQRIAQNAAQLGVERLQVVQGKAPDVLDGQTPPDAVFIGGGLSQTLLDWLWSHLPAGVRLVANGVTLESEAVLAQAHAARGGDLLRVDVSTCAPIGPRRGWKAAYPIVQWSVTL